MAQDIIALSRTYSAKPEGIPALVETNKNLVENLKNNLVDHVRFVVWENRAFPDADCGLTYAALKATFENDDFVSVRKGGGDPFVGVLNSQLPEIHDEGYRWLLVISATSGHLITESVAAFARHSMLYVDAVAIVPPDVPSAGQGAITNQCAYWKLSLIDNGFDAIDARPVDFKYDRDHQGVGELANLFRSKRKHPLAVIYPNVSEGDERTTMQDPRQLEKLKHKERRIDVVLGMLKKTRSELSALILINLRL